jgi:hypothetical protein
MDRVKDLGDASVPFPFDVHAMVYSEDAPTLEWELQRHFADRSLNLVNKRKEFFRVSIEELETLAKEKGLKIYFTRLAEAREYRETLTRRDTQTTSRVSKPEVVFPDRLSLGTTSGGGNVPAQQV